MILSTWGMPPSPTPWCPGGFDDGQRVVFSVEIRKERGEQFSELGGFFKQFELSVIAADERDIVRVRTAVRGETVSICQSACRPRRCARCSCPMWTFANALRAEPRFYHTVSANCTTIIYQMVRAIVPGLPVDYRLLLSGYLPEYLYEHGGLDTSRPLDAIRRDADITQRAARRATRRRSRKPYANLSCPPTMKHSLGLVALRRAAADRRPPAAPASRSRPSARRTTSPNDAATCSPPASSAPPPARRWPCWPGRRQMPRVRAQLQRCAAATAWTPSASCPRCPRSGCCMPWSWNASAPSPRPTATSCWTPYLQSARYAYAYLFHSPRRRPSARFEDRQTQVRDYYNYAVQQSVTRLFSHHRDAPKADAARAAKRPHRRLEHPLPDGRGACPAARPRPTS